MNNRDVKQYYEKGACLQKKTSEWTRIGDSIRRKIITAKIQEDHKRVLDIGCGNGELICNLAEKGHECIGLDISENILKKFRARAKKNSIFQICGNAQQIPLRNSSVDIIICSEVLEHVIDYEQVLKEIYRLLKTDGLILVSVPYKENLTTYICPYCRKEIKAYGGTVEHLRFFDENKLFRSMNHCGFKIRWNHKGPTFVSRTIYKWIKVPLNLLLLIDTFTRYLGFRGRWLIAVGEKKNG